MIKYLLMVRNMIRPNDLRQQINRALSTLGERPLTDSEFESLARDPLAGPIAKHTRGLLGLDGLVVLVQQNRRDWSGKTVTTDVAHTVVESSDESMPHGTRGIQLKNQAGYVR